MFVSAFDKNKTSNPNGTSKDLYTLYNNTRINETSGNFLSQATVKNNKYDVTDGVGQNVAVTTTLNYQADLQEKVAHRATMNQDINDHLNYTMMAMAIWVPLGVFAGYYLYNRGSTAPSV